MAEAPAAWPQVLETVKQQVHPHHFETWFGHLKCVKLGEGRLILEVPDQYFKGWFIEKYQRMLEEASWRVLGERPQIELITPEQPRVQLPLAEPEGILQAQGGRLNPQFTFDQFVVGPSNRFAHAASLAVAQAPARAYNPLFVYGGVGLGKTHLMQAIAHHVLTTQPRLKVLYTTSEEFTNQLITAIQHRTTLKFREKFRTVDLLLIDDIHFIARRESTQEEVFHTFNTLYDARRQIVISSDRSPKEIGGLEERLASRFSWGLVSDIQPPDLETRVAILKKKLEGKQAAVPDEVIFFLADKIRHNIRELEGALTRTIASASFFNQPITLQLVNDLLKDLIAQETRRYSIPEIQGCVAEYFQLKPYVLKSRVRSKGATFPRQVAMYLSRVLTEGSLVEIGLLFGKRSDSAVLKACNQVEGLMRRDRSAYRLVHRFLEELQGS